MNQSECIITNRDCGLQRFAMPKIL
jgi:hypothetical protein